MKELKRLEELRDKFQRALNKDPDNVQFRVGRDYYDDEIKKLRLKEFTK